MYLFTNGFEITDEEVCFEAGKVYICIGAVFTGNVQPHTDAEIMFGNILKRNDEAAVSFKSKKIRRISARLSAIRAHGGDESERQCLESILKAIPHN